MDTDRTVPVARKELHRANRKRSKSVSRKCDAAAAASATVDMESLLATLTGEDLEETPRGATTQVTYYTYPVEQQQQPPPLPPRNWEPRLLIRQAYKVANEAFAVVGLESTGDHRPAIYLLNDQAHVTLTFEDLLSLRSTTVVSAVDRCLSELTAFNRTHLHTVLLEPTVVVGGGGVAFTNYTVKTCNGGQFRPATKESNIVRQEHTLVLHANGWNCMKRLFDCIESYYNICAECSPTVQFLVSRYTRYFTKHYTTKALLATNVDTTVPVPTVLNQELVRYITAELPTFLQELNERRLPLEPSDHWYQPTPLRDALLHWIDAEMRRYCVPTMIDSVLDSLRYSARW